MITLTILLILVAIVAVIVLAAPILLDAAIGIGIIVVLCKLFRRKR